MAYRLCALALCAVFASASASTIADYTASVRWLSKDHKVLYSGQCAARFGTTGVSFDKPLYFSLTCPGFNEAVIYVWAQTDLATVGKLPARVLKSGGRNRLSLLTAEGETLTFDMCTKDC
ncbi:hypothetical protein RVV79_003848 [Burkholderia contaminans]|nr:hypothetical protein [Burkholderia contaminans]